MAVTVISAVLLQNGVEAPSWELVLGLILGGAVTAPLAAYFCQSLPPKLLQVGVGAALISLNVGVLISQLE